ncbi:MAG: hypothetical protein AABY10_04500 [Nanoarchaeota archaeon]
MRQNKKIKSGNDKELILNFTGKELIDESEFESLKKDWKRWSRKLSDT